MMPLALGNATSTLVAQRIGAGDARDARRLGWHGLLIGCIVAAAMSSAVFAARPPVLALYTHEATVIAAALPLVAIDDLHLVAGDAAWEKALFGLYNDRRGNGIAISATGPATRVAIRLPDLASRLAALTHFGLRPLDEPQQRQALQLRARSRGFELPDETVAFLQRRFPRDMGQLAVILDELDAASLAEQRRVTVPFIRQVLGISD